MNYRIENGKVLLRNENGFYVAEKTLTIQNGVITSIDEPSAAPFQEAADFRKDEGFQKTADYQKDEDYQKAADTEAPAAQRSDALGKTIQGFDTGSPELRVIDAKGRLIMPGLINTHTHVYMTLLRNYADDVDFGEWLFNRVMPVEDSLGVEAAYWMNLLGFAEMIRSGTTSYVDMHMYKCMSGKAARDAGMRAFIGRGLVGTDLFGDGLSRYQEALAEKEEYESERIKFILSPHAPYSCSEKLYRQVTEESEKLGILRQTHLSEGVNEVETILKEHGKTPVQWLYDIGFLSDKTILAHCVQMRNNDIELLAASGSSVVTNPASNAKLGNGFAPVVEMDKAGVNICLGTDGTSSNNTLNMFREMGLLSLIHKGLEKDPTAKPAQKVIAAATVNGAKA